MTAISAASSVARPSRAWRKTFPAIRQTFATVDATAVAVRCRRCSKPISANHSPVGRARSPMSPGAGIRDTAEFRDSTASSVDTANNAPFTVNAIADRCTITASKTDR